MSKRIVQLAGVAVVAVTGVAQARAAQPQLPKPSVTVDHDASDGTVGVYSNLDKQPLFGARVNTNSGSVCVGFSYQVPQCVELNNG